MSSGYLEGVLRQVAGGEAPGVVLLALTEADAPDRLLGIAYFETTVPQSVTLLWYIAIRADRRGAGHGMVLYAEVRRRAREAGARLLVMEVEIPPAEETCDASELPRRRIAWYRRLGASLLGGILYTIGVDTTPEVTEMHLMVERFEPMDAGQVYARLEPILRSRLSQIGELTLFG